MRSLQKKEEGVSSDRDQGRRAAMDHWRQLEAVAQRTHADLRIPALGLCSESHRQTQEPAGADLGVRELSEGAENLVSGVLEFICHYVSL